MLITFRNEYKFDSYFRSPTLSEKSLLKIDFLIQGCDDVSQGLVDLKIFFEPNKSFKKSNIFPHFLKASFVKTNFFFLCFEVGCNKYTVQTTKEI